MRKSSISRTDFHSRPSDLCPRRDHQVGFLFIDRSVLRPHQLLLVKFLHEVHKRGEMRAFIRPRESAEVSIGIATLSTPRKKLTATLPGELTLLRAFCSRSHMKQDRRQQQR